MITLSAARLVQILDDVVGTGEEPDGLCGDRTEHRAHLFDSETLGRFWCTADQSAREPWRSERRRTAREQRPRIQGERSTLVVYDEEPR